MNNKLVLLIEDNTDDERLTLRALRRNNVMNEVVVAYDGQEALDYLFGTGSYSGRDMAVMPAVVILDLKLPKLSGFEVLKQIRMKEETKSTPVIVLTSSDDDAQVEQCYRLGANSYIKKPNDPEEYSDMILQLGMYWLLLNQAPRPKALT
ncbi:MAG TPA: response regulator [Fimbriimonadaceae bacterium]|jgi:CheY-like chemotaxis protein